jgi:hypothetical protein
MLEGLVSDEVLFPALQAGLASFVVYAWLRNWIQTRKAGRGGTTLSVTRGDASMARFYATYAAVSGLLIAISLSVDVARDQRVFWAIFDTVLVAYVCLFNPWFRNNLLGWADRLTKIEKR